MSSLTLQQAIQLALQHHQAGRGEQAEAIYRQVLKQAPNHPDVLHLLGLVLAARGNAQEGIALIRRALQINPAAPIYYSNLGRILRESGQVDEAIDACRSAIRLNPNAADALNNLGIALRDKNDLPGAAEAFERAIALEPKYVEAINNLGVTYRDQADFEKARAAFGRALALKPDYAEAINNLGNAYQQAGRLDEAIAQYLAALKVRPDYAEAHNNLGVVLRDKGDLDRAIAHHEMAIRLRPGLADLHLNFGVALQDKGRSADAMAAFQKALSLAPNHPLVWNNLGNAYKVAGDLDQSLKCFEKAMELDPGNAGYHSNRVYTALFHPGFTSAMFLAEQKQWDLRHGQQHRSKIPRHIPATVEGAASQAQGARAAAQRDGAGAIAASVPQAYPSSASPARRLRIGYVSPDFCHHVIGYNILPLLREHDHAAFEVFCYSHVRKTDAVTDACRSHADVWRDVLGLTDDQLAEQIRADGIDILVDLALHLAHNRLPVFARKPAPVQVTFAGYPGGTGLSTMDYRLTDPHLDPPPHDSRRDAAAGPDAPDRDTARFDASDADYVERSIRLPHTFWCYDQPAMTIGFTAIPQPNPLPAILAGHITFGSLNNYCKVSDATLATWSQLLKTIPTAKLILQGPPGGDPHQTAARLARNGIDPARVKLTEHQPRQLYLQLYHQIDIALDTLPYNGHTTSLDALWMGVPVITQVGPTVVGRAGLSQLTNLGLTDLIARTPDEYLQKAATLATDLPRLQTLRAGLRRRMKQSPLMDAKGFTTGIEAAYRRMWDRWLASQPDPGRI
jgi:predicted O-linked N-acetylglucosamine transferase (SPINDLY family)